MPMSAAERQKKYIEKLKRENPEKYESKRKQHLQKVKDRQKKVKSLTDEEKRKEKKNVAKTQQANLSKQQDTIQEETLKNNMELRRKNSVLEKKVSLLNKEIKTLKKKVYRYKFKVNNLQRQIEAYNDVRSLINDEQRQTNRDSELQFDNAVTPQTKASSFVDEALPFTSDQDKEKIKKKLFELNLLTDSLKKEYANADSFKTKDVLKKRQLEVNKGTSIVKKRKKSNHIPSESSESDISITYADSDFDDTASLNSLKENIEEKFKPNTSHTKANLRVSEIKILSNSTINVILDEKTGTFKLQKIPEQTAIPEQDLKTKTVPQVILVSKFEQNKKEQTIENGKRHEMKTDKGEGRLPDDKMKEKNWSKLSGSEKEQKFEVMTDKKEGRIPVDIMKLNVSEIPGSEKEQILEKETDKEERELPNNLMKRHVSEIPGSKKEQRLEMTTHKEEKTAPDDITKQNPSKTPKSENVKRLEMKIVDDKRRIPENEREIPEPILYLSRSFSNELNDETTSDETCNLIKPGKFVLARFSNKRNKEYRYVCRIEDISHGKIVVQGFKSKKLKNIYVTINNDISIIEDKDIIEFLSQPKKEGHCYIFPTDINVKEI